MATMSNHNRRSQCIILLCFLFHSHLCWGGMYDQYFYVQDLSTKPSERHHVKEYLATSGDKPSFLYDPNYPNGRIVEFYAHWCPHCQHFRPKYMLFSIKLYEMAQKMNTNVETFAVSCVPNKNICRDKRIKGYPTTMFFPPRSINGTHVDVWSLHPHDVLRKVGVTTSVKKDGSSRKITNAIDDNNKLRRQRDQRQQNQFGKKLPHFLDRSKTEALNDAHLSFDFAMKTAVYTSEGALPNTQKEVLKSFLEILQKTLPVSSTIHPVLDDVLQNFDKASQDDENLNAILEKHPPPAKSWSPSSVLHGTGYTAGLWTLFHIMSVGLVEWNHLAIERSQKLVPSKVADTLRNYIEHFFQCDVCRLHFISEYDACSYDRCNRLITDRKGTLEQYIQFPLWLYETHNAVNVRLRKERIELHDEPEGLTTEVEVLWPPKTLCPSCWLSEGRWDETQVFKFLLQSYWPNSGSSDVLGTPITEAEEKKNHENPSNSVGEEEETGFKLPQPNYLMMPVVTIFVAMIVVWQRKRRFDRKGMHKKKESDIA